jgi:outer membrane protein TolC
MSASALLDAELEQFDVENQSKEQHRLLAALLDMDVEEKIETSIPVITDQLEPTQVKTLVSRWTESVPLQKSSFQYSKQRRAADFAAANYGIQGNLAASYSFGRGTVEYQTLGNDNIKTNGWGISINLTYPLWDGGASSASVKAARLSAEKARLEHDRTEKAAKAEIVDLLNRIDVGTRKLSVLEKQIELAGNKLDIAKYRLDDGQISRTEYLGSYIFFLETRMKYLSELKNYLVDKLDLEGKFIG